MILSDSVIRLLCTDQDWMNQHLSGKPMIEPFSEPVSGNGVISYGLTSAGYDVRLGKNFKLLKFLKYGPSLSPKRLSNDDWYEFQCTRPGDVISLGPNGLLLAETMEYFHIPREIVGVCVGKSTYARCGLVVNVTPLEPEWRGVLTLELSNPTERAIKIYPGEGIAQIQFHTINGNVERSYADKGGKYQDQAGVTAPIVL